MNEYRARILITDDVKLDTKIVKKYIELNNFQVDIADSGAECIEKLSKHVYDILIIDYFLGDMTAKEAMTVIRKSSFVYTILLTGRPEDVPPLQLFRSMDIQSYVVKGDFVQLQLAIETALKTMEYATNLIFKWDLKETLKLLRNNANMTQADVAAAIGVDRGTYIDYEKGKSYPNYHILQSMSDLFHVDTNLLLGRIFHGSS